MSLHGTRPKLFFPLRVERSFGEISSFFFFFLSYVTDIALQQAMLYVVGLGLGDVDDITVKGLNIVKKCSHIFLDSYTSVLSFGLNKRKLEEFYGKEIVEADRTMVEQRSGELSFFLL